MKKSLIVKRIFISIIIIAATAVIIYLLITKNRIKLYDDNSVTGNTSGNLLNSGLFCENEGKIYFANPYDNNKLYCMDSDLSNIKKLLDDRVSFLNSAGEYIFYTRRNDLIKNDADAILSLSTTGLFRAKTSGRNASQLYDNPTQVACLYGNNVYYQHYDDKKGLELYAAKIDGSEDKKLINEAAAPYVVYNDKIYYIGYDKDHYIHSIGINGSNPEVIYAGNCTSLTRQGQYLYFMDMENNYSLCRTSLDGSSVETIINERLATYNVSDDGTTIYYQADNGDNSGLYKYSNNTGGTELVSLGNFNYLNLTSEYLFFEEYDQSRLFTYNLATGETQLFQIEKTK